MDAALSEIALRLEPRFYGVSLEGVFLGIFSLTMFILVQLLLWWLTGSALSKNNLLERIEHEYLFFCPNLFCYWLLFAS